MGCNGRWPPRSYCSVVLSGSLLVCQGKVRQGAGRSGSNAAYLAAVVQGESATHARLAESPIAMLLLQCTKLPGAMPAREEPRTW